MPPPPNLCNSPSRRTKKAFLDFVRKPCTSITVRAHRGVVSAVSLDVTPPAPPPSSSYRYAPRPPRVLRVALESTRVFWRCRRDWTTTGRRRPFWKCP
eukprot:30973-Pelagococcus_subviridis.AAC.2